MGSLAGGVLGVAMGLAVGVSHGEDILTVYRDALDSDPTLKEAAALRYASQESLPQARALSLPRISGSASKTYQHNFDGDELVDGTFNTQSIAISAVQPIFNVGNRVLREQAELQVEQSDAQFESVDQTLVSRVINAYLNVLQEQADVTFVRADKEATSRQLEQAQRRFEVGLITVTDVEEAQASLDQVTADEVVQRNDVEAALQALREITGRSYSDLFVLSTRVPLTPPDPSDPDVWVQAALSNNPQVIASTLGADIARKSVEFEKADRLPTLDLQAAVEHSRNNRSDPKTINDARIGVVLNVPIYEGGAIASRIREAAFRFEAAKESLEGDQREVVRRVQDAYRNVLAAISLIEAQDQARDSARSSLEATEAGYEVGTRTIVDVLDAQRVLFGAERDYQVGRIAYIRNLVALEAAAGTLSEDEVVLINGWLDPPSS